MYDVLIVDDEEIARTSLKFLLDWAEFGFRIKAEAANGEQALALLREEYFSLVVTDVRMPAMNGLELIKQLRAFSDVAVIILSGYEDFEYARQGIKMGIQDYLLKPVDEEELAVVLRKMYHTITNKNEENKQFALGKSVFRDHFLKKWMHGKVSSSLFDEHGQWLGMHKQHEGFRCMLVEMDFFYRTDLTWTEKEIELKRFAIRNIIDEICQPVGIVFEESEERYGIIVAGSSEQLTDAQVYPIAQRISESVHKYAKETVSIGLGEWVRHDDQVPQSLIKASEALDGKFLMGHNTILNGKESSRSSTGIGDEGVLALQEEVMQAMTSLHREHVSRALQNLWDRFKRSQTQEHKVKMIVLEMLAGLFHMVKEVGADHEQLFDYEIGDYEHVMKARTMADLYQFIEQRCYAVLDVMHRQQDFQSNQMTARMKQMIDEQFFTNISLRSVAKQVYMNPVYLGQLFKVDMGCSFNDYLLKVRMEKAKELLVQTDKKVYEIAQAVGYRQLDWFYKRFKAYTGFRAGEYRTTYGAVQLGADRDR